MNVFSQVAVIALLALVGVAFLFLSRGNEDSSAGRGKWVDAEEKPDPGITMMPPMLYVEQLDPRTMEMVERFEINDIPTMGISISRPNAIHGSIKLNPSVKAAYSVSENHVRIGMDTNGLFIQDQKNDGRMRLGKTKCVVEEVDIKDGLLLYVGIQPLRFVIPDLWQNGADNLTMIFDAMDAEDHLHKGNHFARRRHGH